MLKLNIFAARDEDAVQFIRANEFCLNYMDARRDNMLQLVIKESPHNLKTIAYLLEVRPSFTKNRNFFGRTALHIAVEQKQICIVDQIMHADKDAIHAIENVFPYQTPYHFAARANELEMIKSIVAIDPTVNDQLDRGYKRSVLHFATDPDVVTYLLKCKSSLVDAIDALGNTPLHSHLSLGGAMFPEYSRTVQILLEKTPSLLHAKNNNGHLALDIADQRGLSNIVEICLRFDPTLQYYEDGYDSHINTVLHLIAQHEITDTNLIVRMTAMRQSELLIRNVCKETPLDVAISCKKTHAAETYRRHCPLDHTLASYHKHSPKTDIDMWAVEQCSFLNTYLCSDLVRLILSYLNAFVNRKKKTHNPNVKIKFIRGNG